MVMALGLRDLLCRARRPAVEVHQAPVRRGMGKDHTPAAPVTSQMRPGARRRIARAELLGQRQGDAALAEVRFTTTTGQGSLEHGELLGKVGPDGDRRTRGWWIGGARLGGYRWRPVRRR